VYAAAIALGIGIGIGMVTVVAGLSGSQASSPIPAPPANKKFVADDNGAGADNQANIMSSVAPGLVHIVTSRGIPVGLGVILTPSGIVLTSDQILQGAGRVTVRTVLSGQAFTARVIGLDAAQDLALLQLSRGTGFKAIAVGNSGDFAVGSAVTAVGSTGTNRTFALDLGNVTSLDGTATVGGRRLTGLVQATSEVLPGQETGGPLVNLSGQAIGIDVAGTGSGLRSAGFAIPINRALAVARRIEAGGLRS
jgi:S1-C subfamily serine protease